MAKPFRLGQLISTPGALEEMEKANASSLVLIDRHAAGDWGELCEEDKAANDQAARGGGRLLSAYTLACGAKVWVITEAADAAGDRACATVLLPDEY
jgi:hypothetical protein